MRRLLLGLLALALVAAAAAPAASTAAGRSGLKGSVTLEPTRPVCVEGQPCSKPAAGVELVFRKGACVKRVTTGADGSYRILLRPGLYTVTAPAYRAGAGVTPPQVRVLRGKLARVDLVIDTGLQ